MDSDEKKRLREHIGRHVTLGNARLTDYEALKLAQFIDEYDQKYRGTTRPPVTKTRSDFSSDGRYRITETFTDSFPDRVGIRQVYTYETDEGGNRSSTKDIHDARGILQWLQSNH